MAKILIKDGVLVKYEREQSNENVVIPEGVTCIGRYAFVDYKYLETWFMRPLIPTSVKKIDEYAFSGAFLYIFGIDVPGTVREIGNCAFEGKSSIAEIKFNEGLEKIGSKIIYGQKQIKKLYLPSSLKYIAADAFENCSKQLKFYVETEDCYAAQYLKEHNFKMQLIKKDKKSRKKDDDVSEVRPNIKSVDKTHINRPLKCGYRIRVKQQNTFSPGICDSKYGGQPYWDKTKKFPCDSAGNELALIAQFNLEQLDTDTLPEVLPRKGMLQFFISSDPALWNKNYKVVYHSKINYSYKPAFWIPELEDVFIRDEIAIELEYHENTQRSNNYYSKSWLLCYKGREFNYHPIYEERELNEKYNQLLFQLDSEQVIINGSKKYIAHIGDEGFFSFFINADDLAALDFSDVFFHTDCF